MITSKLRFKLGVPKILLIDDEVQLAEVCRAVLQNAGAKAKVIYDGADAEHAIDEFRPDLIISDIRMPEVRGDELLVILRERGHSMPVIMITGLERSKVSIPRESPNLFTLLYKPIEYDQLVRTVQNTLNVIEARRINELLLKQLYEHEQPAKPFAEWQEERVQRLIAGADRRAS